MFAEMASPPQNNFAPSKQWHGANETLSDAGLNCRLVFIFGAEKSSKKCVCVCFWEVYVCGGGGFAWAGGRSIRRSGRGEREDCRGVVTWVAPLQLGERERQAEMRLRGEGTSAQPHFHFCRISSVASFFSVSLHSTE